MMEKVEPEQTEDGMLYRVMLTQMSGVDALASSKQTEVLRVTLTAADEKVRSFLLLWSTPMLPAPPVPPCPARWADL